MRRKETTDFVYTNRMHKAETNREIEEKKTKFCFSSIVEIQISGLFGIRNTKKKVEQIYA